MPFCAGLAVSLRYFTRDVPLQQERNSEIKENIPDEVPFILNDLMETYFLRVLLTVLSCRSILF